MTAPHQRVREFFYGEPEKAVPWLAYGFGAGLGWLTRSPALGLASALLGRRVWDHFSARMVIQDQRLGQVTLRVPQRGPHRQVWLTFDDGPGPETVPILELLAQYGAQATFFFIGENVSKYGDLTTLAEQIKAGGHRVGNHSWSHPNFLGLTPEACWGELETTHRILQERFSSSWLPVFRPPFGYRTEDLFTHLGKLGLHVVGWNLNSLDFLSGSAQRLTQRVIEKVEPNSILLFHDGPVRRERTLQALPAILEQLHSQGYSFTVPTEEDFTHG